MMKNNIARPLLLLAVFATFLAAAGEYRWNVENSFAPPISER